MHIRFFLSGGILFALNSSLPIRSIFLAQPDKNDLRRFEYATIPAGATCFQFGTQPQNRPFQVTDWTSDIPFFVSLDQVLQTHQVRSCLVIQNDTIQYQYYRTGLDAASWHSSYSIAKAFTSALVGIAIDEGFIPSVQTKALDYLPELAGLAQADQLTIEHLLNHTSGIGYDLTMDAVLYYGRDARRALRKIRFATAPGQQQHYLNINVALLGLILKRATDIPPAQDLTTKIWQPLGMCHDAVWSVDEKRRFEKTFCCLGATALDYAKFGRLYLHQGVWEGQPILSQAWFQQSIRRDSSRGSSFHYNYCWYMGLKAYGDFMAIGLYKQHLYIHPKKNLIIVLFNDREKPLKAERVNWWFVFRQIADQL